LASILGIYAWKDGQTFIADSDSYEPFILEWDMKPFTAHQPKISLQSSIGNGVDFLNKNLSMKMFGNGIDNPGMQSLLDFLRGFKHNDTSLLLSKRISTVDRLRHALLRAERALYSFDDDEGIEKVDALGELGFLEGWGSTVGRVRESFEMLLDLIQAPDSNTLERFLCRLPLVFRVVILSPHGFFGQNNVLGLPDTGGQVCSLPSNLTSRWLL
jgi:sucrose synthase